MTAILAGVLLGVALAVLVLRRVPWLAGRLAPPARPEPERRVCFVFDCTGDHIHPRVTG